MELLPFCEGAALEAMAVFPSHCGWVGGSIEFDRDETLFATAGKTCLVVSSLASPFVCVASLSLKS